MSLKNTWFFIVNPKAGGGSAQKKWIKLLNELEGSSIEFDYALTTAAGEPTDIVSAALAEGYRQFVVVGGDGSVSDVVNAIFHIKGDLEGIVLTVLPWGTGNDWARFYSLPKKADKFLAMLEKKIIFQQDLGLATYQENKQQKQRCFVNFLGAGFDCYVLEQLGSGGGNQLRYLAYVLKCLKSFPGVRLYVGDKSSALDSLLAVVCVGEYGGGGMRFAPKASVSDGLFEVAVVKNLSFIKRLRSIPYLFNGKVNQHSAVDYRQMPSLLLESESTEQYFHCDGEIIAQLPCDIALKKQALSVAVPCNFKRN